MSERPRVASVDFVTPDLFGPSGGIARISRAMSLAIARWASAHGLALNVHALMDRGDALDPRYLPAPHVYRAYRGRRLRLARELVARMLRPTRGRRLVVIAHPHLAVLRLAFPPWVRTAVVAHGIDVATPLRRERRFALRGAHALWPVSRDTAAQLVAQQGVEPRRIRVVENALDPFWPLPEPPARRGEFLLSVGRLHPGHAYKGFDLTLEALAQIPAVRRPPLVIVGDGPDRARLEALAARLGVSARFAGAVDDAALAALYRGAGAFVLPSTREGFGLVYLEAMASALPCIAARAGGAPEVVRDGETGVVIPPGDVGALAAAIEDVLGERGAALGLAGRARVERELSYPAYERRVHEALDALLTGD